MNESKLLTISAAAAVLMLLPLSATAATALSTEFRSGAQYDEWFVRGDASVAPSTVFSQGTRLSAWDAKNADEATRVGIATAAYFFQVPPDARSLSIQVIYRVDPNARDQKIAGFLFVRDLAVQRQLAGSVSPQSNSVDEPGFYGDTYVLPADQGSVTVTVPTADRVADGVAEVHVSADAGQMLDVQSVMVSYYAQAISEPRPSPAPGTRPAASTPSYVSSPYQYSYDYYYAGPWYYPYGGYLASYYPYDYGDYLNPFHWSGWPTYRACFWYYHPWITFPLFLDFDHDDYQYHHHHQVAVFEDALIARHRDRWLREHFNVDPRTATSAQITELARDRRVVLSSQEARQFRDRTRLIAEQVQQGDHQLRTQLGSRFGTRIRQWNADPSLAHRELAHSAEAGRIQQAASEWRVPQASQPRAAVLHSPGRGAAPSGATQGSLSAPSQGQPRVRSIGPLGAQRGEHGVKVTPYSGASPEHFGQTLGDGSRGRSVTPERSRGAFLWSERPSGSAEQPRWSVGDRPGRSVPEHVVPQTQGPAWGGGSAWSGERSYSVAPSSPGRSLGGATFHRSAPSFSRTWGNDEGRSSHGDWGSHESRGGGFVGRGRSGGGGHSHGRGR